MGSIGTSERWESGRPGLLVAGSVLLLAVCACRPRPGDDAAAPGADRDGGETVLLDRPEGTDAYAYHQRLADQAGREGRWDDVIEHLREAIRVGPYVEEDRYLLGSVWLRHGDLDAMTAYYREQIATDPKPQTSHFFLGRALAKQGDLEGAIEEYARALDVDPAHELSHQALGEALEARGDLAGAERHYRRAVQVDPTFDPGWDSLLAFLRKHGSAEDLERARKAAAAADDDPRHRPYYWARILVEEGREDAAREELRRVLDAAPDFQPARELAAELGMEIPSAASPDS